MAAFISLVRVKRTGSSISSRPVKERVWPLCGVAEEKEAVLELGRHQTQHSAQLAVFAEGRRHQVVALVDDQQVPGADAGNLPAVRHADRNCSSTSGCRR